MKSDPLLVLDRPTQAGSPALSRPVESEEGAGGGEKPRLRLAFRLALGHDPKSAESDTLLGSYHRYLAHYTADPADAAELVKVGMTPPDPKLPVPELAAWTLVCSTLFNLDEFLTQH